MHLVICRPGSTTPQHEAHIQQSPRLDSAHSWTGTCKSPGTPAKIQNNYRHVTLRIAVSHEGFSEPPEASNILTTHLWYVALVGSVSHTLGLKQSESTVHCNCIGQRG